MKTHFALLAVVVCGLALAADVPPNPANPPAGIEHGAWSLESWGNSGAAEKATVGDKKLLKLIYTSDGKDKTSFKHLTFFSMDRQGKMYLHVYTDEDKPPQVGIAISTTRAYRWHESQTRDLKKGWNKLEFTVGTKDWKTQTSNWKFSVPVEPCDEVRAVSLLIYNGNRQGVIYVDGWTYDPDETGKKVAALIKDLQSEDVEARAKAEKGLVDIGRPATEMLYQVSDDERPEVLLRAASALRQIEEVQEELPSDPNLRGEIEKQREEQHFDEVRRRADYALHGMETERSRLLSMAKDAQAEVSVGRVELDGLKYTDVEKRKAYSEVLDKIDQSIKELKPLVEVQAIADKRKAEEEKKKAEEEKAKAEAEKKAEEEKAKADAAKKESEMKASMEKKPETQAEAK